MPPGVNGLTVAEQIFICGGGGLFCDNYVTGGGTLIAQYNFHDVLRVDTATLTGFAPGQPFSITEVFDFTQDRGTFPFAPQGGVGATIMTTPGGDHSRRGPSRVRRSGACTRAHRRCWPAWSDIRERWPSRLVATAEEDRPSVSLSNLGARCSR